ncbi:type II secretion system protein GspL [Psychrobacter aquaticus]|uniref:Putative general secretion pathway protein L (GspL family) n=1 Tax=Psychrobacter aquaticus CMS 56 TaxID=1354303 RepID=U4T2J1_9GAMM|nr:type II secretion system protein GspL [Psychrobacter aquaticus]ERL54780.1 putative general secretion pathway protein L (GspL family) [Psychrobacter aquaticus CMS 56]
MLHVWLRAQHSPLAVWHEDVQQWQSVDGWQQLQAIYGSFKTNARKTLCLYFPSTHVLQVDTALNTAQLKQLGNSGKQYLFEETSLTPVEQLSIRQVSYADNHYLYALAQSDIESWQQSATLAGMSIAALLPDFLLLPIPIEPASQQVTLYQDTQTMLLRQSLHHGMAVSYLPLVFERFPQLSEVNVLPSIETSDHSFLQSASDNVSEIVTSDDSSDLQKPSVTADFLVQTERLITEHQLLFTNLSVAPKPVDNPERHALNFFIKSTDSQLSPYLRVAMMVALSALVLQMATDGVQWYQYKEATAATKTEIARQYQSWFADEPLSARTKLQVQLQPKLRSDSQAPAAHMAALARISPLIKQSSLRAQTLVMQPSTLSFTLIAPDRGSLDQFTSTLTAQGLNAKLAQVNSNEQGQFSGQITVNVVENNDTQTNIATS